MSTVLVVDDLQLFVDQHIENLSGSNLTIVTATSLDELFNQYAQHREELAGIILDGCIPGDDLNTMSFIRVVKDDALAGIFKGYLIAASSDPTFRRVMLVGGCTHEAPKSKAAELLLQLLSTE